MLNIKFISLSLILFLSACGSVPQSTEVSTNNISKQAVLKLSDLNFVPYTYKDPIAINITGDSQSYSFQNGQSNLAAFKVGSNLKILEISSQASGIFIPTMTVYLPTILFLDTNHAELQAIEPKYYYSTGKMNDTRPSVYYGAVTIPEKTAYAIIYSDTKSLTNKAPMLHGSAGADRLVTALREEYSKIDSKAFANSKVKSFVDLGYRPSTNLTRSSVGSIRVHFSE